MKFPRVLMLWLLCAVPIEAEPMPPALDLASGARERAGLPGLRFDARLAAAAEAQARHMAARGQVGHRGPGGAEIGDRLRATGFPFCHGAENVAAGQRTAAEVMRAWMASSGHRRNILNPNMTDGAVAAIRDGQGRTWWAMVLAGRC